jgi:hypothetical protein
LTDYPAERRSLSSLSSAARLWFKTAILWFKSHSLLEQPPGSLTLFSPDQVRTFNQTAAPGLQIPLPAAFNTLDDILQLPLQSVTIVIGDPRTRQANGSMVRTWSTVRLFAQDTWRVRENLTLNYGLAWTVDSGQIPELRSREACVLGSGSGHERIGADAKEVEELFAVAGICVGCP